MLAAAAVLNMVLMVMGLILVLVDLVVGEMVVSALLFHILVQRVENLELFLLEVEAVVVLGMELDHNWVAMVVPVS